MLHLLKKNSCVESAIISYKEPTQCNLDFLEEATTPVELTGECYQLKDSLSHSDNSTDGSFERMFIDYSERIIIAINLGCLDEKILQVLGPIQRACRDNEQRSHSKHLHAVLRQELGVLFEGEQQFEVEQQKAAVRLEAEDHVILAATLRKTLERQREEGGRILERPLR